MIAYLSDRKAEKADKTDLCKELTSFKCFLIEEHQNIAV
jgi:hypothetical protein